MEHQEAVRTHAAERYLLEEMTDDERDRFEAHFFECALCADEVRTGAALADGARDARTWQAAAPAASVVPFPARERWNVLTLAPLAAAAALAVVVGYQSLVTVPRLREAVAAPRALSPIAVAPTSRGEAVVVPRDEAGGPVVLSLDINADPAPRQLVYDLRTDAGEVVLTGRAPVPPQGTPLLLLLPGTSLTSGQYAIIVRDDASPATEVGTYRFIVR